MNSTDQAVNRIKNRLLNVVRGTVIGCASRIIKRTPVKDGTLIANWQASISEPVQSTKSSKDKAGSSTIASAKEQGKELNIGEDFYMTNNLPYAYRIEFGSWSKLKAPEGMMRVEVAATAAAINANRGI